MNINSKKYKQIISEAVRHSINNFLIENYSPDSFIGWSSSKMLQLNGIESEAFLDKLDKAEELIKNTINSSTEIKNMYYRAGNEYNKNWDKLFKIIYKKIKNNKNKSKDVSYNYNDENKDGYKYLEI